MTAEPVERRGRADLHIHTLASDGTASIGEILDTVAGDGFLDVIAITDHERIDAALAARAIAADRGLPVEIVVGEEITTRGGHLLGLFLERRVPPLRASAGPSRRSTTRAGSPSRRTRSSRTSCARRRRPCARLLDDDDPAVHPDAIETFNPTALGRYGHARAGVRGASTACRSSAAATPTPPRRSGACWTSFPGRLRGRPARRDPERETGTTASSMAPLGQLGVFGRQLRSGARRPRRGPRPRPPRRDRPRPRLPRETPAPAEVRPLGRRRGDEDRARLAVRLPAAGRRDPARPLPVREPAAARPRRPHPDLVARPPAHLRGRRHPPRQGVLHAGQRVGGHGHGLASLRVPGAGPARARAVRRPPLP